jgi:hypothetical protein
MGMREQLRGDLTDNPTELLQAAVINHRCALVTIDGGRVAQTVNLIVHARDVGRLEPGQDPADAKLLFDQPVRQLELTFEESELDALAHVVMAARREFARKRRENQI